VASFPFGVVQVPFFFPVPPSCNPPRGAAHVRENLKALVLAIPRLRWYFHQLKFSGGFLSRGLLNAARTPSREWLDDPFDFPPKSFFLVVRSSRPQWFPYRCSTLSRFFFLFFLHSRSTVSLKSPGVAPGLLSPFFKTVEDREPATYDTSVALGNDPCSLPITSPLRLVSCTRTV